jgi:hypothetical protein
MPAELALLFAFAFVITGVMHSYGTPSGARLEGAQMQMQMRCDDRLELVIGNDPPR